MFLTSDVRWEKLHAHRLKQLHTQPRPNHGRSPIFFSQSLSLYRKHYRSFRLPSLNIKVSKYHFCSCSRKQKREAMFYVPHGQSAARLQETFAKWECQCSISSYLIHKSWAQCATISLKIQTLISLIERITFKIYKELRICCKAGPFVDRAGEHHPSPRN